VLARICHAAADHSALGGGLLVNYCELPAGVFTRILPQFGMSSSEKESATINRTASQDAKAPHFAFAADSETKQRQAGDPLRALAEQYLRDV
jgi:hypothetical protein